MLSHNDSFISCWWLLLARDTVVYQTLAAPKVLTVVYQWHSLKSPFKYNEPEIMMFHLVGLLVVVAIPATDGLCHVTDCGSII